ncbi:MAG TPA: TIGR03546 family protein [bacterium]
MLALKFIGWILKALKEGPTPRQLAGGIVLGFALGTIPGWPLQVWLLLLLVLILQVNLSMVMLGAALGSLVGLLVDPLYDAVGGWLLRMDALAGVWTSLYNSPPWGLTRFNNTVVMGSFVVSVLVAIVAFPLLAWGVRMYRERFLARVGKFKVVQMIAGSRWGSRLFGFYQRLQQLGFV